MSQKDIQQSPASSGAALDPLKKLQQAGFGALLGANSAWLESLGEMGAEFAGFLAERIKEDVKTQHEILHCRDIEEMQQVQARFMKTAIEQYQAETGKLVKIGMDALSPDTDTSS